MMWTYSGKCPKCGFAIEAELPSLSQPLDVARLEAFIRERFEQDCADSGGLPDDDGWREIAENALKAAAPPWEKVGRAEAEDPR